MLISIKEEPSGPISTARKPVEDDMNQFFLLYDEWELAEETAGHLEACVSEQLERYCNGAGAAPSAGDVARLKTARQLALQRLRALRAYIAAQRLAALVI
jgi:hypothetical protein